MAPCMLACGKIAKYASFDSGLVNFCWGCSSFVLTIGNVWPKGHIYNAAVSQTYYYWAFHMVNNAGAESKEKSNQGSAKSSWVWLYGCGTKYGLV